MTVEQLIEQLKKLDPQLEVLCYCEDEELQADGYFFRVLEILDVDVCDAEKVRGDDGTPTLKLGESPLSKKLAIINITSEV